MQASYTTYTSKYEVVKSLKPIHGSADGRAVASQTNGRGRRFESRRIPIRCLNVLLSSVNANT